MITILKGDKGNVDLKQPLELNIEDKDKLLEFLRKELFYTVEEEENKRSERMGEKSFSRNWTKEEYILLLTLDKTNEEVSKLLGRSWMSIEMKRLSYIPEMMDYANKKGVNILRADKKVLAKLVEDYVIDHEEELLKKSEAKKEESRKLKQEKEDLVKLPQEISKEERLIGVSGMGFTKEGIEAKKKRLEELKIKFETGK